MRTTEQRIIARLRELAAVALMLVAIPMIASCGGGGDQGNGGGGEGGGGGQEGGQAGNGGGGGGQPGGTTGGGGGPLVTDVRIIVATPDQGSLDGNRARLGGQEVREVVSERAFYVGENDAERLLVLNTSEEATAVSEGQTVAVAGRLTTPRPAQVERLSLSPEETTAVEDQEVFLRAARVTPREG